MQEILGFAPVPAIIVLCMLIGQGVKIFVNPIKNEAIPFICAISGLALSVIAYFTIPAFIEAGNWMVAAAVGVVSGLAATGAHQLYKQNKN